MANADYIKIGFWEEPTDRPIDREAIIASYRSAAAELKETFPNATVFGGIGLGGSMSTETIMGDGGSCF